MKKINLYDCSNNNNNNTIKYSCANGFVLRTNNKKSSGNNNYKSILKDSSRSKRCDNESLKKVNYNSSCYNSQNSSEITDINDLEEESTSFLTSRIQPNYSHCNQYDYKSSAV